MPREELDIARKLRVVKTQPQSRTGASATVARVVGEAMAKHPDLFGEDTQARRKQWAKQAKWAHCVVVSRGMPAFPVAGTQAVWMSGEVGWGST